jgi:Transglutaminase-like superfamily
VLTDVRLALRMAGWSLLLPLLKRVLPLKKLTRLMWAEGRGGRSLEREREIARLSVVLTRLRPPRFQSNCLERSLLAYRFLSQANVDPHLVIAVSALEDRLVGHAWVTVDGRPVHDSPAEVREFVSVVEFGAEGRALDGGRDESVQQLKSWV